MLDNIAGRLDAQLKAAGQHVYVWLEQSAATNTTTWLGDDGASNYFTLMGITGSIDG
jgi:hypothetical protein